MAVMKYQEKKHFVGNQPFKYDYNGVAKLESGVKRNKI